MKSIGLYGRKLVDIQTRECEIDAPGFNDVIVKIHACGVCGTDINFLSQWTGEAVPLGHELAAEVVEAGKGVKNFKAGDRVIVEDCSMCGTCVNCKHGRPDQCLEKHDLGGQPGMAQYMRVRYNSLVPFDGLSYMEACLTEPLSVALNSVLQADIPFRGSVAVLGCGPLGLMTARIARLRGAGFVAISEINTHTRLGKARADLARSLDVDRMVDSSVEDLEKVIRDTFPGGVDRVIVSAPPESLRDALKIIGYGGVIVFYGLHFGGRNRVELDINDLIFRKITLRPFFAEPAVNFSTSIDLLKRGLIPARDIVTHTFSFQDAPGVFQSIVDGSEPVIKAVMLPDGPPRDTGRNR